MKNWQHLCLVVSLAWAGAACGDGEEGAGDGTTAEGGETTSGGEVAAGVEAPPGSTLPDDGGWDGDAAGVEAPPGSTRPGGGGRDGDAAGGEGGAGAQAGGAAGGEGGAGAQAGGAAGGDAGRGATRGGGESPWGSPVAEQGRPLPPRRPMNGSARNAYEQGLQQAQAGNTAAASSAFQRALSADPNAYQAAYNLGVLADRAGDEGRALEYYRRALRIQPDYERAAEGIVRIHLRRGNVPDAIAFVDPLARRWERNLHLQALLAETLVAAGRYDDAWEAARRALRRDERFVPAMIALVKASLKQGREELAEAVLDQALAIDGDNAELHFLKGRMLLEEEGRLREAIAELRRAVELAPDFVEARMTLGIQMMNGANYAEALQQFEAAARLAPTLVAVHLNLADAYRANKRWEQAKASFEQALRMEPNLPEAHFDMGLMYMTAGEEFPGLSRLQALQKAAEEFRQYRNMMGARLPRNDPSEAYLADLDRQIEREQTRLERERVRAQREAERAAREGGGEGGGE